MTLLLTVAGLAACYLLARLRFAAAAAAIATIGVGAGSGVLWYAPGSDDQAAAARGIHPASPLVRSGRG